MNKLEQLIQQLCPEGVEWKTIESVCKKIASGGTPSTANREYYDGDIPWLRTQEVDWKDIYDTSVKITEKGLQNSSANWIPENCVIIAMYGATAAKVAVNKIPLTTNQACCNLSIDDTIANYKYVYYWISSQYQQLKSLGEGSQSNINGQKIKKYPIPIPPIAVQEEIVNILDKFTALEAELEAELEARSRQYEYYRNQLLSFEGKDLEWKTLKSVFELKRGTRVVKSQLAEIGEIPVYQNSLKPLGYFERSNVVENSTYIICAGAAGDIGFSKIPFWAADDCFVFTNSVEIDSKYLYYFLKTKQDFLYSRVRRASIPRLSRENIENIKIPVPPLKEQERIVAILDQFDALVNDISTGLPAEIQARRQQYEYYRGKLLTFEPVAVVQ